MFLNQRFGTSHPIETKSETRLAHVESQSCWCDPIVEVGEYGEEIVLHKEVTWH